MPEWLKGADCKSAALRYVGSNPTRLKNSRNLTFKGKLKMSENKEIIYYSFKLLVTGAGTCKVICFLYQRCTKKFSRQKIKDIMIKIGIVTLGANVSTLGFIGRYCKPSTCRNLKNAGRALINLTVFPYTGPSRLMDLGLQSLELLFFGRTFPLSEHGFLLLEFS